MNTQVLSDQVLLNRYLSGDRSAISQLIVTSTQTLDPMPVITGAASYPQGIVEKLKGMNIDVTAVDALSLAEEAGSAKASNVVLMGVVSKKMDVDESIWQKALEQCVPTKFLEMNRKAFALGREA